jgi:hypothetical protein
MRNADKTVDRLLAGLRNAEPSAGLEQRILHKIEAAMEARPAIATDSAWRLWRLTPAWVALVALLAVCLFVATETRRQPRAPSSPHSTAAPQIPESPHQAPIVPRHTAARVSLRHPRASEEKEQEKETEVANLPPPPLPLTEQEKLLLRLAHRRDTQNMAILNRNERATQSVRDTQQFQEFFGIKPAEMRTEIE